ncbi:MAG: PAS domain-containing sensor histidine kinase [Methanoregula sp.]|jgi:PAS domain S-box-containing protein|nr:PAS domain-containing sensor histidine kinase [Methanoregula sp.]
MVNGIDLPECDEIARELLLDYGLRFRTMADHIHLGMIQVTSAGNNRVLSANPVLARMLGYDHAGELSGMFMSDLFIHPEDVENLTGDIVRDGCISDRKTFLKRKDGSEIWVSIQVWKLNSPGSPVKVIEAFVEDMTEHLVIEQEMQFHESELNRYAVALAHANKKLNLLSNITRHDLINKMMGLSAYLAMMREDYPDPKIQDYLNIQEKIIESVNAYAQFTKDYQELGIDSPQWFNVKDAVDAAVATLALPAITLSVETGNLSIYADPMLEKVFYNLIDNTLSHGGGNLTRISFSVETGDDTARIIYTDDGCGVPEKFKEAIFVRKHFKHTGFGLYLSREILGITSLTITENGKPGNGVRFEITIPRENFRAGYPAS